MSLKKFLVAVWTNVIDDEGYPKVQLLKSPTILRCGDTIEFKLAVGRTDLIPKKAASIRVKIP